MPGPADDPVRDLDRYRDYLLLLARAQIPDWVRGELDASDLVQQTLMLAHRDRGQRRGTTGAEMAGWLRGILTHKLKNAVRDIRRDGRDIARKISLEQSLAESSARLEDWLVHSTLSPDEKADRTEQLLRLASALVRLPDDWRQAVELRYLQGLSVKEVAEAMGRTTAAVGGLLHRALVELRSRMADSSKGE
jgi:RNA polymerase sigma-70 factor (ECF subfamily)